MVKLMCIRYWFIIVCGVLFITDIASADGIEYQINTSPSLIAGHFQAVTDVKDISKFVTFGVGAAVGLGEVIVLNGKFYLAGPFGSAHIMKPKAGLTYLTGTLFKPQREYQVNDQSLVVIEKRIQKKISIIISWQLKFLVGSAILMHEAKIVAIRHINEYGRGWRTMNISSHGVELKVR